MGNIGPLEIIIVLVIVLVIFGPKRLPQLGRQLGSGMREFKDSITSKDDDDEGDRVAGLPASEESRATVTPTAHAEPAKPADRDTRAS